MSGRFCDKLCPVSYVSCVLDSKTCGYCWVWTSQESWLSPWGVKRELCRRLPTPDLMMGCWAEAHSPQLQSGSKLLCFAPFSHHCVMLRLACPCTGTRGMGPIRVTHRLLLASSQHLWRHVFSAPGSHTYLWPSLPLISRFSRHPSGMAGEKSTRHLFSVWFHFSIRCIKQAIAAECQVTFAESFDCEPWRTLWCLRNVPLSPDWLLCACVRLWTDVWLGEVLIRSVCLWPHHLPCWSAGLPRVS